MSTPEDLLAVWFADGPDAFRGAWFTADPVQDEALRARFGSLAEQAAGGTLGHLAGTPSGALALCLLLDQLPRNLHRGAAQAFAGDPAARQVARDAVLRDRHDRALAPMQRVFLYLPFEHSEDLADQDLSVALFEGLRDDARHAAMDGTIAYAWRHRRVVRRFGRFPHRNAALGRATTPAEAAFLVGNPHGF
ncbi:DUF924 family protein [Roseomonas sp. CCTCC AB2023176]|uniref:DUF924 family protein n=1 Tax=Roseomonas sp. CCTCC AB2023176 TaxID=3342640 RepID=UPI0035DC5CB5